MIEEQSTKEFTREDRLKEIARREEIDLKHFQHWLESMSQKRRESYLDLDLVGSDNKNKEYVLRECRFALELIDSMRSDDERKIVSVGIAIHGSCPVVLIQAQGHETISGKESLNELTEIITFPKEGGENTTYYCSVDTSEYGVPTTDGGLFKYKLDKDEVEKRLSGMSK